MLLLAAVMFAPWVARGQSLTDYSLLVDTVTFNSIASTGTAMNFSTLDDGYATVNLPFSIAFGESSFASGAPIACSANGFLQLGVSNTSGTTASYSSSSACYLTALLQQDAHLGRSTGAGAYCQYDATAGTFTIEYHLLGLYSEPYGAYSYQIVFHSNSDIEIIYDSVDRGTASPYMVTYLSDGPNNDRLFLAGAWANPTMSLSYTTRPITNLPAHGLRYRFVRPTVSCPKPIAITVSNKTATGFDVSWTDTSSVNQWKVELLNGSIVESFDIVSDTTVSFTELVSNTDYTVAVSAICGYNDTSAPCRKVVHTFCAALDSLPYFNDFESAVSSSSTSLTFVDCMFRLHDSPQYFYPYVYNYADYSHSGNKCLYWYHTNSPGANYSSYECMILPNVDTDAFPINTLEFSFWARTSSTGYYPVLYAGVMSDPADINTFVPYDTINISNSMLYEKYSVDFSRYTGGGQFVALQAPAGSSYWYVYLDDVQLRARRDCPIPTVEAVQTLNRDSITVAWAVDDSNSSVVGYDMVYGPHGFNPDTATTVVSTSDTFYFFTDEELPLGATYDVYVRSTCGDGESYWSEPLVFTAGGYYMPRIGSNTITLTACEGIIYDDLGPTGAYGFNANSTLFVYPADSTKALRIDGGSSYTYSTSDYLRIYEGLGTSGRVLFDDYAVSVNQLIEPYVTAGGPITIQFRSSTYNSGYTGFQLRLSCVDRPECQRPENFVMTSLGSDSVAFSWNDYDNSAWRIKYGPSGFDYFADENDDTVSQEALFSTTTGAIGGLTPNTAYDFYLSANCGSEVSLPQFISLVTACYAIPDSALPYHYGFEDATTGTNGHINECWRKGQHWQTSNYPYASTGYHAEGNKSLYFYGYSGTYLSYAAMPMFESPVRNLMVTFKLYKTSQDYGSIELGVMTDPNDYTTFTSLGTYQPTAVNIWEEFSVTLSNYRGNGRFIAFMQRSTYSTYLDDITVDFTPTCPPVVNVAVPEASTTSAYVTWEYRTGYPETPDTYLVTIAGNGSRHTDTTNNQYYMATGLASNTEYTVVVTPQCSGTLAGADSTTFTTRRFSCAVNDTSLIDTVYYSTDSTQTNGIPVYSSWGNTLCQSIFTVEELTDAGLHAGDISGIDLGFYQNSTYPKEISIYLATTNINSYSSPANQISLSDHALGCAGVALPVGSRGWHYYEFDTPFTWDGSSNLVVTVLVNQPAGVSQTSSGFNGYSTATPSRNSSVYRYKDSNPYTPTDDMSGNGYTGTARPSMVFHTTGCAQEATCARPLVRLMDFNDTEVELAWAPGGNETAWNVEHREAGATSWTTDLTATTATTYRWTGLTPNTEYEFRVSHSCTEGTFATVVSASLPCTPVALPMQEGFATWATGTGGTVPECWHKFSSYSTSYPYVSTSYSSDGDNRSMYFYSTNTTYTYLLLPLLDARMDTVLISFDVMRDYDGYTHEVAVGVVTDPNDFSTFRQVGTAYPGTPYEWSRHEFAFSGMPYGYIALASPRSVYGYPYVDNILAEYFNPCVRPYNITPSSITLTTATLSWNDSTATNFEYQYGPRGFALGTGTMGTVSGTSRVTISGLRQGTNYDFYVRGICSAGDTSNWSFATTFATTCGKLDSFPFFEDFNSWGSGTSVHAPNCWISGSDYSTSYPYIYSYYNHSGSTGGGMYMYNYTGSNPNSKTWFTLPELDTTVAHVRDLQAVFYTRAGSTGGEQIYVGVCSIPGVISSFTPIDTIDVPYLPTTYDWQLFEVPLNRYAGNDRYITFVAAPVSGNNTCYPSIDDLTLERIPSCQRPDSLTAFNPTTNSIDLQWRSRSEATQFVVEYGYFGFTPGTGTQVIANSNPFTLSGLPTGYQGEFYVRNICGAGDTGDYSRVPAQFTLQQVPATIPYSYNFEDASEWDTWHVNSNTPIYWSRGTAMAYDSNYSMYISTDGGATFGTSMTRNVNASVWRDIDFGPTPSSFDLTFRHREGATLSASYDALMVFVVDTNNPVEASDANITTPWGSVNDLYRVAAVRLDTNWTTARVSIDTISGVHRLVFFWFNQNTGDNYPWVFGPAAVDDISIVESACPRPLNMVVDETSITSSTARVSWDGSAGVQYRVAYRVAGTSPSTNAYVTTSSNNALLTGLSSMTNYEAWVQKICGTDSSVFSDGVAFATSICDDNTVALSYDNSWPTTTDNYAPMGYSYYNYGYVQTLIDSAQLAALAGPVTAMSFSSVDGTCGNYYTNMDIYLANVPDTDLSAGFIIPNNTNRQFVQVTNGANLTYTDGGWHTFVLDTTFEWDGHSNVLVSVNRRHGTYSSGASFNAHSTTGVKTRYIYEDGSPYSPATVSGGTSENVVGDLKLIACGAAPVCHQPLISGITYDYQSATITWMGEGTDFEVNIKETSAANWPATDIPVAGTTYTFTGLNPSTDYTFRVRQNCTADSAGYSDWVMDSFVTDSLPCLVPDGITVADITNTHASVDWNVNGTETAWDIHVWFTGGLDSIYRVTAHPATVGGFMAGLSYNVAVRPLCGVNLFAGDWSDTVSFTTATCPNVTNMTVSNVTANSATISWAADPQANSWIVEYGFEGFNQGTGTTVTVSDISYTATGLECEASYDFYVRAVCGTDWVSENWTHVTFTTADCSEACNAPTGVMTNVTGNSVAVSWTPAEGNTAFEVEYGARGFSHGNGTVVSTTEPATTINGLEFNTQYDLYVRALCGADNYSPWTGVATFTTATQGIHHADATFCTIYPNPASGSTTISVSGVNGKVKIEVVDMNGRAVATETLECSSDCTKTMDVDHLSHGAYFVRITSDNVNMVRKLIVR